MAIRAIIVVDDKGEIVQVLDENFNVRQPKTPDRTVTNKKDVAFWNEEERCVYDSSGRCYC
jgi:hypothetical protein